MYTARDYAIFLLAGFVAGSVFAVVVFGMVLMGVGLL